MTKKKSIYLILSVLIITTAILVIYNITNRAGKKVVLEDKENYYVLGKEIDYEFKDYFKTLNLQEMEIIARQIASAYLMDETIKMHLEELSKPIASDETENKSFYDRSNAVTFYAYTRQTAKGRNIICSSRKYISCIDSYLFFLRSTWGRIIMPEMRSFFLISLNNRGQAYLLNGFPQNHIEMLVQDQLKVVKDKETALEVFDLYALSGILGSLLPKDHAHDSSAFNNYKDIVKEKTIVEKENAFIINASFKKEIEYTPIKTTYEYNNVDLIISKKEKVSHKIIKQRIGLEESHHYE